MQKLVSVEVLLEKGELTRPVLAVEAGQKASLDDLVRLMVKYQAGLSNVMELRDDMVRLGLADRIHWPHMRGVN